MTAMYSVSLLLFYVFAVMGTKLYGDLMPEQFGTLGAAFFTLFQLMTLDDWANIVKPAMEASPFAMLYFFPFIVVATFVVLNLFIGVIVESIQSLRASRESADATAAHTDTHLLLAELRALGAEVAALRRGEPASPTPRAPHPTAP